MSSVFDFLTFGVLLGMFRASVETFRPSWFVESLLVSTAGLIALTFAIPYLPFATVFGFVQLPVTLIVAITTITALYVVATALLKKSFYLDKRTTS